MISGASVNVLDFGAKGDGTTDDGPAIQLAINSLPSGGTVVIPKGEFLISTGVFITKGIRMLGAGRANFNGYTSSFSPTVFSGATLIRVSNGVTAFSFNKGTNVTAFGCSIEEMSFASAVISQAAYGAPPVFPANTHAINLNFTAELVLNRLDFMNLDKCIFNESYEVYYTATSGQTTYTYNWLLPDVSQMAVYVDGEVQATNTYTVTGAGTGSGTVVLNSGVTAGLQVALLTSRVAVKASMQNLTAKDCNYFLKTEDAAADFAVSDISLIKMNYGIHTTSLDGLVLNNAVIYRSYISAMYDVGGGINQISNFINISNSHFFESGSTLCYFHSISQLTITGCDFVRAGLVTNTVQTGLLIYNSETVSVSGGMIERSLGDGAQVYGNRYVDFATNIMYSGYTKGNRTGLVAYDNQSINVDCNITCVGVNAAAAANFQNSKSVSGVITSDDIVIGRTETLVQRGVTEYVQCLTFPSVIGASGNVNLAVNIPYFLNGNINSVGALSGQSLVVYEIEFPTGGSTTGVEGLTFRVNGPTQTFNNYIVAAPPSSPTVFAYTFTANSDSSIAVYKNGTLLTLTTDYTVSGAGSPGGNITLTSPAAVGDYIWAGPRNDEIGDFSTVLDSSGRMEFRKQIDYNITGGNISDTFSLYLFNNPSSGLGSFTIAPGSIIKVKYKVCEYAIATY